MSRTSICPLCTKLTGARAVQMYCGTDSKCKVLLRERMEMAEEMHLVTLWTAT
eukprot:XP_001708888.1 Hypothetical protein GL50803_135907 [Giardia lamblia ATCC 50803]